MRGATYDVNSIITHLVISIHAPHARSDCLDVDKPEMELEISIHAPHARSDGHDDE